MSASIEERLDELADLFRRRLLDDRDKRRLIDAACARAQAAEDGMFRQFLHPVVVGLAQVIDRIDAYDGAAREFVESLRDELLDVLGRHGVVPVSGSGPVDPTRHEVVAIVDDATPEHPMEVERVLRRGFEHAGWVFRPARVVAGPFT